MWSIEVNDKYKPVLKNDDHSYELSSTEAMIFTMLLENVDKTFSVEAIGKKINKDPRNIANLLSKWNTKGIEGFPLFCEKGRGWRWWSQK